MAKGRDRETSWKSLAPMSWPGLVAIGVTSVWRRYGVLGIVVLTVMAGLVGGLALIGWRWLWPSTPTGGIQINVNMPNPTFGVDAEKLQRILAAHEARIRDEIRAAKGDERLLRWLHAELSVATEMLHDIQAATREQQSRLGAAVTILEKLKKYVTTDQVETARRRLADGDSRPLEEALAHIVRVAPPEEAAQAAYQLGELARGRGELRVAEQHYRVASERQPHNAAYSSALKTLHGIVAQYAPAAAPAPTPRLAAPSRPLSVSFVQPRDGDTVGETIDFVIQQTGVPSANEHRVTVELRYPGRPGETSMSGPLARREEVGQPIQFGIVVRAYEGEEFEAVLMVVDDSFQQRWIHDTVTLRYRSGRASP